MINEFFVLILSISLIVTAFLMLVKIVFYNQIKRVANEKHAEIMNWFIFNDTWNKNPNDVFYAWNQVVHVLKTTHAPKSQIVAAEKEVKRLRAILFKPTQKKVEFSNSFNY